MTPFLPQRADPHLSYHEGWYYFTASVPEFDRLELRRSRTVDGLKTADAATVFRAKASGPQSWHLWAPELHRLDGAWYLYYAAGDRDDIWKIRPYVLECRTDDPTAGPWTDLGPLRAAAGDPYSFEDFSLDATVFEHRSERYLVWAQKVGTVKGVSNLYLAKLATPTTLATVQVLLTTPDYDWERVGFWVNEGPAVIVRHGRVWVTFSASATGACYCVGLLSAPEGADLTDPEVWTKERRPVFATDASSGRFGPGHNSFCTTPDGRDLFVWHARTYERIEGDPLNNPDRHTYLTELKWDEAGRPVFG